MLDEDEEDVEVVEADADLFGSLAFVLFNWMLITFSSKSLYWWTEFGLMACLAPDPLNTDLLGDWLMLIGSLRLFIMLFTDCSDAAKVCWWWWWCSIRVLFVIIVFFMLADAAEDDEDLFDCTLLLDLEDLDELNRLVLFWLLFAV